MSNLLAQKAIKKIEELMLAYFANIAVNQAFLMILVVLSAIAWIWVSNRNVQANFFLFLTIIVFLNYLLSRSKKESLSELSIFLTALMIISGIIAGLFTGACYFLFRP